MTANEEIAALKEDLETERMRLTACGVIAMANTRETAEEARKMRPEYRSASLGDVERAVDREIQYREELAEAQNQIMMLREALIRSIERMCFAEPWSASEADIEFAKKALSATADLSGLILCEAEPVAHWNGSHCDAHYRQYQGNGCMIPLYKGRKQP